MRYEVLGWFVKGIPIIALFAAFSRILGLNLPARATRWLAWSVLPVLLLKCYVFSGTYLSDFKVFYYAGREVAAGRDPYLSQGEPARLPYLNPPTFQPLAIALSVLPYRVSGALWVGLNIAGTLGLVELSRRVLNQQGGIAGRPIPGEATAGLLAAVALSTGSRMGLELGQLHAVLALVLLGALWARALGRPILAGLLLAPATFKPQTLLPFLILFLRRSDIATWATLAVVAPLLILTTTPPHELIARYWSWQASVRESFGPGRINDISYSAGNHETLVSLSHVLYGLGMKDPDQIRGCQSLLVILLGLALLYEVAWRNRLTRPAASALVACYAMVFLYHRSYDTLLLTLPLVYATAALHRARGTARASFMMAGVAILIAMNAYTSVQTSFLEKSWRMGAAGRLIRALVIPYPTYAVLLALGTLWLAVRLEERETPRDYPDDRTPTTWDGSPSR